jgi:hypothetical protein
MIICGNCGRAYVSQTALAGRNRRKNDAQSYRHRKKEGHCFNRQISARRIEPIVWNKMLGFLLNPIILRAGYAQALEEEIAERNKQSILRQQFLEKIGKVERSKQILIRAYTDPDIGMTKAEYIEARSIIDQELEEINSNIGDIETYLNDLPTSEDFKSLEHFAEEIRNSLLGDGVQLSKIEKRHILELLQIKVILEKDGISRIESWHSDAVGLLSQSC